MSRRRVLLKISGEALAPKGEKGVGEEQLAAVTNEVKAALESYDLDIAMVVGEGFDWNAKDLTSSNKKATALATKEYRKGWEI